jgi:hypothetical protein
MIKIIEKIFINNSTSFVTQTPKFSDQLYSRCVLEISKYNDTQKRVRDIPYGKVIYDPSSLHSQVVYLVSEGKIYLPNTIPISKEFSLPKPPFSRSYVSYIKKLFQCFRQIKIVQKMIFQKTKIIKTLKNSVALSGIL